MSHCFDCGFPLSLEDLERGRCPACSAPTIKPAPKPVFPRPTVIKGS